MTSQDRGYRAVLFDALKRTVCDVVEGAKSAARRGIDRVEEIAVGQEGRGGFVSWCAGCRRSAVRHATNNFLKASDVEAAGWAILGTRLYCPRCIPQALAREVESLRSRIDSLEGRDD
jgi:hypothetical protein